VLKDLKAKDRESSGLEPEDGFFTWDYRYYDRMYLEQTLQLDENEIKEYFPVSKVVPTILGIYQDLLGVRFEEAKGEQAGTWHEEVQAFAVWDKDAKDGKGFMGWCYLDLFPRRMFFQPMSSILTKMASQLPSTAMLLSSLLAWAMPRALKAATTDTTPLRRWWPISQSQPLACLRLCHTMTW
jgi:hypothetical protein